MTEDEYICATNLAKLRLADDVLRNVIPMDDDELTVLVAMLARLVEKYERKVIIQS